MDLTFSTSSRPAFQSTLLMRGATRAVQQPAPSTSDFNPRSSCEERLRRQHVPVGGLDFNPRSSCEERRTFAIVITVLADDFNPRSSCEERLT